MNRYKFISCFLVVFAFLSFFTFDVFAIDGSYEELFYNPNGGINTYATLEYEVCDSGEEKFGYTANIEELGINDNNHSDCIRLALAFAKKHNMTCIINEYSYKQVSGNSLTPFIWHKYDIYLFNYDVSLNSDGNLVLSTGDVFPKFDYSVQMKDTNFYGKDENSGKEYYDLQNVSFSYYSRNGSDLGKNDVLWRAFPVRNNRVRNRWPEV